MRRLVKISVGLLILAAIVSVLLLSASVYTYNVLTGETLIAELRFEPRGPERYLAYLRTGDLCEEQPLEILGDQWRIDARFLKWRNWALLLGLDSQYRLDRLEGRYRNVGEQNSRPTRAYDLNRETTLDVVDLAESLGPLNFLVDATYGSSTFEDIDPDRIYLVYKSPTGIFTRSRPPVEEAVGARSEALTVEVRRGCGEDGSLWEQAASWTDAALGSLL